MLYLRCKCTMYSIYNYIYIYAAEETIRSASVATIPTFGNELKVMSLEMQMANN